MSESVRVPKFYWRKTKYERYNSEKETGAWDMASMESTWKEMRWFQHEKAERV